MPRSQKSRRLLLVKPAELLPFFTGADSGQPDRAVRVSTGGLKINGRRKRESSTTVGDQRRLRMRDCLCDGSIAMDGESERITIKLGSFLILSAGLSSAETDPCFAVIDAGRSLLLGRPSAGRLVPRLLRSTLLRSSEPCSDRIIPFGCRRISRWYRTPNICSFRRLTRRKVHWVSSNPRASGSFNKA